MAGFHGVSQYKGLSRDMWQKWVPKSASWFNDDPLFNAKTGINMGHIFKIVQNLCENRPNFINLIPIYGFTFQVSVKRPYPNHT